MKNRGQWLRALLMGVLIELIKGNNRWIGPTQAEFPTNIDDGRRAFTGNIQGSGYPVGDSGNTPDQWQKAGSEGTIPYDSWGPSDSQIKSTEDTNYQIVKVREDGLGLKNIKSIDQSLASNNQQNKNDGWSSADVQDKEYINRKVDSTNTPYDGSFTDMRTVNNVIPEGAKKPNEFAGQEIIVTGWKPLQDGITLTAHEITNSDWNKLQENGILASPEITAPEWNRQYPEGVQTAGGKVGQTGRDWQPDQNQQHDAAGWRAEENKNNNDKWANSRPHQQTDKNVWGDKGVQESVDVWQADDKRQDGFNNGQPTHDWNPSGNAKTTETGWNTQENVNNWNSRNQQQEYFQNEHYGPMNEGKHEGNFPNAGDGWATANKLPSEMGWSNDNSLRQKEESWKQENEKHHSYNEQNRQQSDNTWKNPAQPEYSNNGQFGDIPLNPGVNQLNNGGAHVYEDNVNSNEGGINNENYGSEGLNPSNTWSGPENSDGGISNFQPPEDKHIGTNYEKTHGDIPENFPGAVFPPTENTYGNQGIADNVGKPIEGPTDAELAKGDIGREAPGFAIRQPQGNYKGSDGSYHTGDNYGETSHENTIPGTAGQDYPNFLAIPNTAFDCKKQEYPGYFADIETGCQVYHVCQADGRHNSFLCPTGTIFNQKLFTCDWWFNYDCSSSAEHYPLNLMLYREGDHQGNFKGSHYPGGRVNGAQFFPQSGYAPASNTPHQNQGSSFGGQVTFGNDVVRNDGIGTPLGEYDNQNENPQVNDFPVGQNEQEYGIQVGGEDGTGGNYNSLAKEDRPEFGSDPKTGGGRNYNSYNDEGNQNFGTDLSNERGANTGDYNPLTTDGRQKFGTNTDNWEQKHLSNEEWNSADNYDSGNAESKWGKETQNDKNVGNMAKWEGPHHNAGTWTPEGIHTNGGENANEYHKNFNDGSSYPARDEAGIWDGANRQNWDSHSRFPGESKINEQNTVFVDKKGNVLHNGNNIARNVPDWNKVKGNAEVKVDNRNSQWIGVTNQEPMPRQNIPTENIGRNYNEGKYDTLSNVRENTDISPRKGLEQGIGHFANYEKEIPARERVYGSSWNPKSIYYSGIRRVWEDTDVHRAGELGGKTVHNVEGSSKDKKENANIIEGDNGRMGEKRSASIDVGDSAPKLDVVTEEGMFVRDSKNYGGSTGEGGDIKDQYRMREGESDRRITRERDEKYVIPMRMLLPVARKEGEMATVKGAEEALSRGSNKYAMPMEAIRILPEIYGFRDSSIELRMNPHVDKRNEKYIIPVVEEIRDDGEKFRKGHDSPNDRSADKVEGSSSRQRSTISERLNESKDDRRYNLPISEEKMNEGLRKVEYNSDRQERGHSTTEENWRSKSNREEPREQYHQESSERHYVSVRPDITKHTYHDRKEIMKSIGKDQLSDKTEGKMSVIQSHAGTVQISKSNDRMKLERTAESGDPSKENPKVTNTSVKGNLDNASKKPKAKNSKMNLSNETKMGNSHTYRNRSFIRNHNMTKDIGPNKTSNLDSIPQNGAEANYNKKVDIEVTGTDLGKNTSLSDSTLTGSRRTGKSKIYKVIVRNRLQSSTDRPSQDRKDELENDYRFNSKTTPLSTSFS